ncbi:MAG: DNA-3-methyladenine glycosylase I [Thaumarchaeota archaeon]|nr:DNA-3-methyladenine glycosylase I [Nitrososphaerota archaeon]
MAPAWKVTPPKDDADYFGRMSKAIFTAGLNWKMVENKWPAFQKAFFGFSPAKVARLTERDVATLMKNQGIVRNEKKIRATVENAKAILAIEKEFGSIKGYIDSFGGGEVRLQKELQEKFKHVGPSTARMFLWMVEYPLTPTREEKMWMKGNPEHR